MSIYCNKTKTHDRVVACYNYDR